MTIDELQDNLRAQQAQCIADKEKLEEEFSNMQVNPYGVTTLDFEQRQKLVEVITKLQGGIEALELAKEQCDV
tara:strand:- start:8004 stop:8222 length:219 start_codon:yes stop_codon:yes gene_type:complete